MGHDDVEAEDFDGDDYTRVLRQQVNRNSRNLVDEARIIQAATAELNRRIYIEEGKLSAAIVQMNRHRSVPPYEWFGPNPEPHPAGDDCGCQGCRARFGYATISYDSRE